MATNFEKAKQKLKPQSFMDYFCVATCVMEALGFECDEDSDRSCPLMDSKCFREDILEWLQEEADD